MMRNFNNALEIYKKEQMSQVNLDDYLLNLSRKDPDHKFLTGATQATYIKMINFLGHYFKNKKILDWGAGKGQISYLLRDISDSITSCDIDSGETDSSFYKKRPILKDQKIHVKKLNHPFELPFANNFFDLVTSFGVLEHVKDDKNSLKELSRIIKKNGCLYISFLPYKYSWTQNFSHLIGNYYHDRLYSKSIISELVQSAGFEIIFIQHGQLFPKNSLPYNEKLEKIDRFLTNNTPLKFLATNLELFLRKI